jgi:hypothetical protein
MLIFVYKLDIDINAKLLSSFTLMCITHLTVLKQSFYINKHHATLCGQCY